MKKFYYKKNRLQQFKGFYYTVLLGSPTKAAEQMSLSQAAISIQIKSLEDDIGIKLFSREKKKLILTKEGRRLYDIIIPHVQGIEGAIESFIHGRKKQVEDVIDIAANHVSISYILPKYIKRLKDTHPDVEFKIRNIDKYEALGRLLANKIDFFIYPYDKQDVPQECEFLPIVKYQPIVLVAKNHPIAIKGGANLEDLSKYELIRIDPKLITLPAFEEIIRAYGFKTKIEFEGGDWEMLKQFVRANIGIAMISNVCLSDMEYNDLVAIPITQYFPEMIYGVLIKKGKQLNDVQKIFIKSLTENYR
jgi:DNA-binding transcriptional LysR family regulator